MGGVVKGSLLTDEGLPIWQRLLRSIRAATPDAEVWLVGDNPPDAARFVPTLADDPAGRGPLGGLSALLKRARAFEQPALALASDLPCVSESLLRRLLNEAPDASLYAPRIDGVFQPLFARFAPHVVLPLVEASLLGPRASLLSIFERTEVTEMPLDTAERAALLDWDTPLDLPTHLRAQLDSARHAARGVAQPPETGGMSATTSPGCSS